MPKKTDLAHKNRMLMPALSPTQALATRSSIQVDNILRILAQHAEGKRDLSPTQLGACKLLLDKSLPNLAQTTITGGSGEQISIVISADDYKLL